MGGDDVSGISATNANALYCKQEYVECRSNMTPMVVNVELPKNNAILLFVVYDDWMISSQIY